MQVTDLRALGLCALTLLSAGRVCRAQGTSPSNAQGAGAAAGAAPVGVQAAVASSSGNGPATPPPAMGATAARHRFQAKKVVGALVGAIRFDKRKLAPKYLGFAAMADQLLGPTARELTATEREQFVTDFAALLVANAFPKGHDLFAYLDGVLYGEARQDNSLVRLPSTIVVHRNLKKTEFAVEWVLAIDADSLKVVDIVTQQESTIAGIREQEVLPLLKEGGKAKLLSALHEKAAAAAASKAAAN